MKLVPEAALVTDLLAEYDLVWRDLAPAQIGWRPESDSSAIGWHFGHQRDFR